ncbi:MAG TPA: sigma-54 dependent transcriptional regulator [Cyclobacteriaceae bacterium]
MKKYAGNILIVEDDEDVALTSRMILKQYFDAIEVLPSPKSLESKLRQNTYDVILLDMNFKAGVTSGNEGLFWLNRIQALSPLTQVVLQTAYGDIDLAVRSIKEGAVDFLAKPWDKDKLVFTIINAFQQARARRENREHKVSPDGLQQYYNREGGTFIASAPSMTNVLKTIEQVSATDANVLILGENGTGKELVALAIHNQSRRTDQPFVSVDLGAIPPSLFESEMFGHEKGSFTDAKETRIGKFELANKGTLFLDEIGNLSPELQVKLLSALQTRNISRIGSNAVIRADVRIICATNAPINDLVRKGTFRNDLYYRINTVEIRLPPLRERKEDIPLLLNHYLEEYCRRYHKTFSVDPALAQQLTRYDWPGNVRELQHAIERAVILCSRPELTLEDFQLYGRSANTGDNGGSLNLSEIERDAIRNALRKFNGNLSRAAEELGIGRTTLYRKMEAYGIGRTEGG